MAFCYDRSPCSSFPIPTGKHLLQPCTPSLYTMLQMLHDQRVIQPKYYILMPSNDRLYLVISDFDLVCCQELKVYGHSFIHSFFIHLFILETYGDSSRDYYSEVLPAQLRTNKKDLRVM